MSSIDNTIADLEEGFRNLIDGVMGVLKVIRDENALLQARLDERRLMDAAPGASPTVGQSPSIDTRSYVKNRVKKFCETETCRVEMFVAQQTRFCKDCVLARNAARNRKSRAPVDNEFPREVASA